MSMLDTFAAEGKTNVWATCLYRVLARSNYTPEDNICGTVFISNESMDELKDFTLQELQYMLDSALYWRQ